MFDKILVPVDLTHRNRGAVQMAARLIHPDRGTIHLIHVVETIPGIDFDEERHLYKRLERAASEHLGDLGKLLDQAKARWQPLLAYGPRAKTILDEAEKLRVDLIVIQSHRVDEERRQEGWGTLSYQVGVLARCPVLLVK